MTQDIVQLLVNESTIRFQITLIVMSAIFTLLRTKRCKISFDLLIGGKKYFLRKPFKQNTMVFLFFFSLPYLRCAGRYLHRWVVLPFSSASTNGRHPRASRALENHRRNGSPMRRGAELNFNNNTLNNFLFRFLIQL